MKKFADLISTAIVVLFITGTAVAVAAMVSHPERYIQQPQAFSVSAALQQPAALELAAAATPRTTG